MRFMLRTFALTVLAVCVSESSASAAIIVSYSSSTSVPLVAGSGASLDVFVRSSDGTDMLDGFQVEFGLTSSGGPVGGIRFVDPQSDAQLGETNYVFFGRSLSANTGAPVGAVSGGGAFFSGYDATDDGTGFPFAGNQDPLSLGMSDLLLFRLNFEADFAGDYVLNLSADFFSDQLDPISFPLPIDTLPGSFTLSVSSGAAAVPEPGTFGVLALFASAYAARRRFQDRANPPADAD
jgi:hypothetical protein